MTVTVPISEKEPSIDKAVPSGEPCKECSCNRKKKNDYLWSIRGILQIAQIVFGLVALILIHPPMFYWNGSHYFMMFPYYTYFFLTFNAVFLSEIILWDELSEGKVRRRLGLERIWSTMILYYLGIMSLLYYFGSFVLLAFSIRFGQENIVAGVLGLLAGYAYTHHWWLQYTVRVEAEKVQEALSSV
ncbi:uncharacterized protein LOC131426538 [Malaya genurostris]|uniref:uncharacterized protein LOC131426538 n=1 Tax=Malaya genurostris TaxID=325434 RepID=UPI0026F3C13F|nr:uncharacterized protein LOC131426538 [Malaya genurostris]